mgnify:CR=1 FL=1
MPYQIVTSSPMDSEAYPRRALPEGGVTDMWTARDGWPLRRFTLGSGVRGSLLFLGGRADMIEKYVEPIAFWAGQGWRVTSFDWRGQGGSGRLTARPHVGHIEDFGIWVRDLSRFVAEWQESTSGPHVIVAHSMGAHVLLRGLATRAVAVDAIVMTSPMLDIITHGVPLPLAQALAATLSAIGFGRVPIGPDQGASEKRFQRLTHSRGHFEDEMWWRTHAPELYVGPPSWRWLREAFLSCRFLEQPGLLERVQVPALILGTTADQLVDADAIERVAHRMPNARLHIYGEEAAHEILRESDTVRMDALDRITLFLNGAAPAA